MDDAEAWDLELELLLMPTQGGSIRKMGRLAERIDRACSDVPEHVRELGAIRDHSNRERDLHRWVNRQVWRTLLPDVYEYDLPWTSDHIHEDQRKVETHKIGVREC